MVKFTHNYKGIRLFRSKLEKEAWGSVVEALDAEMDAVIEDPNEFEDLGFDNQDIVDTGRFLESKTLITNGKKVHWEWNPVDPKTGEHYAAGLYNGFYAYDGTKWIPGRPWPERAIERVNPTQALAAELKLQGMSNIKAQGRKKI